VTFAGLITSIGAARAVKAAGGALTPPATSGHASGG